MLCTLCIKFWRTKKKPMNILPSDFCPLPAPHNNRITGSGDAESGSIRLQPPQEARGRGAAEADERGGVRERIWPWVPVPTQAQQYPQEGAPSVRVRHIPSHLTISWKALDTKAYVGCEVQPKAHLLRHLSWEETPYYALHLDRSKCLCHPSYQGTRITERPC